MEMEQKQKKFFENRGRSSKKRLWYLKKINYFDIFENLIL